MVEVLDHALVVHEVLGQDVAHCSVHFLVGVSLDVLIRGVYLLYVAHRVEVASLISYLTEVLSLGWRWYSLEVLLVVVVADIVEIGEVDCDVFSHLSYLGLDFVLLLHRS